MVNLFLMKIVITFAFVIRFASSKDNKLKPHRHVQNPQKPSHLLHFHRN